MLNGPPKPPQLIPMEIKLEQFAVKKIIIEKQMIAVNVGYAFWIGFETNPLKKKKIKLLRDLYLKKIKRGDFLYLEFEK
jgi:hypothetical protein